MGVSVWICSGLSTEEGCPWYVAMLNHYCPSASYPPRPLLATIDIDNAHSQTPKLKLMGMQTQFINSYPRYEDTSSHLKHI